MIKFLFCDLDDTLIKRYNKGTSGINKYNLIAIEKLKRNGVNLVINTARSPFFLNKLMKKELDYDYIAWNGAEIYHNQELILTSYVDKKEFHNFIIHFPNVIKDMRVTLCDGTAVYESRKSEAFICFEQWGPIGRDYDRIKFTSICELDVMEDISDFHLFFHDKQLADDFYFELMQSEFKNKFRFSRLGDGIFDVTSFLCNKGNAIKNYLKYTNNLDKDFAAIGDSANDIVMLELTEYSFCMESGSKDALRASNYHVKNVAECIQQIISMNKRES